MKMRNAALYAALDDLDEYLRSGAGQPQRICDVHPAPFQPAHNCCSGFCDTTSASFCSMSQGVYLSTHTIQLSLLKCVMHATV